MSDQNTTTIVTPEKNNNKLVTVLSIALCLAILAATIFGAMYLANKNTPTTQSSDTEKTTQQKATETQAMAECTGTPSDPVFTTATPEIVAGSSATISWIGINNADSALIDQGVGEILVSGGSKTVTPAATTIYTLTSKCSKSGQIVSKVLTITVKPAVQVTSAVVTANPATFTGTCPKEITYTAKLTANAATDVTYKWVKSDGSSSAIKSFKFNSAGSAEVTDKSTISASGWEKIVIITPNGLESNQAAVTISCITAKDFSGSWYHNFGTASITQTGSSVTGTYYNGFTGKSGTIAGNVVGDTLTGTWTISGGSGSFKWTASGDTFDGKWNDSSKWCGAKSGKNFADGCGYAGKWNAQLANKSDCEMKLTQKNTSVSGTYCNGTISGNVSYTGSESESLLTGNWVIGDTHGNLKFYLLDYDGKKFQGNYDTSYRWCGSRSGSSLPGTCLR